jgi:tRNA-Thr(GGU) m(6)t(6)A37 methyltransferase TsaA
MKPIAIAHTLFKEKFSIPRQPGLIQLESSIELLPPYNRVEALTGISEFSHIWLIFSFHEIPDNADQNLTVRPPRLGGNKKLGVFATRSPFRPNRLGLSLVKLERIEGSTLIISGADLLDQTPIYDIKPYLKEVESITNAQSGWTSEINSEKLSVEFQCEVDNELKLAIAEVLSLDPRPSYHEDQYKKYGSRLGQYDIHWEVRENKIIVFKIDEI